MDQIRGEDVRLIRSEGSADVDTLFVFECVCSATLSQIYRKFSTYLVCFISNLAPHLVHFRCGQLQYI